VSLKRTSPAKRLSGAAAILVVGSLLAVTPAGAQSELDQYTPAVPDSEGGSSLPDANKDAQGGGGGGGGSATGGGGGGTPIPGDVTDDLEAQGSLGEGASGIAGATAPKDAKDTRRDSRNRDQDSGTTYETTSSPGAVASTLGGESDEGMGLMLPLLLALTLVAAVGYLLLRWRRNGRERAHAGAG
jgi:hypothetical protein